MALPPDRTDRGAERYLKDDWHGLQLFAIDGAQFRTPDKPELREYYGSANTSTKRQNAYPVMRLVALMNLGSHILLNAVTAPYRQSETVLALNQKGCNRHWLLPAWKNIASEMIELGNTASPGTIPKRLEHLRGALEVVFITKRPRPSRPRSVKISKTRYPVKHSAAPLK